MVTQGIIHHQAYMVFDECDIDKRGTIGRAEGEVIAVTPSCAFMISAIST